MIEAKGRNGSVSFDGGFICIRRSGLLARMTVGRGEKKIPVAAVTSLQWKSPDLWYAGYIEFSIAGGNEVRSQFGHATRDAAGNENAVLFDKGQMPAFEAIRTEIEHAIATYHKGREK